MYSRRSTRGLKQNTGDLPPPGDDWLWYRAEGENFTHKDYITVYCKKCDIRWYHHYSLKEKGPWRAKCFVCGRFVPKPVSYW